MIINDLDLGGDHPSPHTSVGQVLGAALVAGSGTRTWPLGGTVEHQDVGFAVTAWQALGGAAAMSPTALRYRLRQLEELCLNPDLQPVYIQWAATQQSGEVNIATAHDGWYVPASGSLDYSVFEPAGWASARLTVSRVAPASPAGLGLWWSGGLMTTTYTGGVPPAGIVLGAYPVGSTAPGVGNIFSRTGAEGVIPLSGNIPSATPNPLPFVRPATVAALFAGGVRVLDTINTGSNPIPTAGLFLNANWVQVYGPMHDFVGDCVITNGLLLLLFQVGQSGAQVWLWNTKLGTPAWQQFGTVRYFDNSGGLGSLREVTLDRVGQELVRMRTALSTSNGAWLRHDWRLGRGHYHASFDAWALTQAIATATGVDLVLATAAKITYNDAAVCDMGVGAVGLAVPTTYGHATVFGTAANGPLGGLLYQNPPSASQPVNSTTTQIGSGDSNGPAQGTFRTYGVFAVPFTTAPNLQAEGEAGSLPAGWSSVANGSASGGNEAKCISGTLAAVRNLFGTSWQPIANAGADVFFRLRVTTNVGSALEFKCGLWDITAAAYVANGSVILNRTAIPTAYGTTNWFKANTSGMVIPVGHNVQFAAEPALTLGTDWFVDEAVLLPRTAAAAGNVGSGDWPADIWAQFMQPLTTEWVPG